MRRATSTPSPSGPADNIPQVRDHPPGHHRNIETAAPLHPARPFSFQAVYPGQVARPAFDLDNFAKPVLDTLFTSQNVSRLTGVLLPQVNDTWLFRLHLEKVQVKTLQEQGADI